MIDLTVDPDGTIRVANFEEATTRRDFYSDLVGLWSSSPADLADAMSDCQPLAWVVQRIYSEFRDELSSDLSSTSSETRIAALTARLCLLPEEPEDGASDWVLGLTTREFEELIVDRVDRWFDSPPNWSQESDFLPRGLTSKGAAMELFVAMASEALDGLGVFLTEGASPGSTYYAAKLDATIDEANRVAREHEIPVRFYSKGDEPKPSHVAVESSIKPGSDSSSGSVATEAFVAAIRNILTESPGSGSFSEHQVAPDGSEIIHRLSMATGMAASSWLAQYRNRYGDPPDWSLTCHPVHRRRMYELALDRGSRLPSQHP